MKIYTSLRAIWVALLISALAGLTGLTDAFAVNVAGSLLSLAAYAIMVLHLKRLADESVRFGRAFAYQIITVVLLALSIVCSLLMQRQIAVDTLSIFALLLIMTGGIFNLLSEFNLFWALDERIIPQGYAFPARRIRWCFYAPLLCAVVAATLQMMEQYMLSIAAQYVGYIIMLALFWLYLRAVKAREDDPLT